MPAEKQNFAVADHILVPQHILLSEKEKDEFLQVYNISTKQVPVMRGKDPAIKHLNAKPGDIIKIVRKSQTSGASVFYRAVE